MPAAWLSQFDNAQCSHCLLLRPRALACVALNLCQVRSTHLSLGISGPSVYQPTLPASIFCRAALCVLWR